MTPVAGATATIHGAQAGRDITAIAGDQVTTFNQRGQTVHGPQTNIAGDVHGPVLSGEFHGPVTIAPTTAFRPGSAPPPPALLVGRAGDLCALKAHLIPTGDSRARAQILTAIKGWPGVGKTTLAAALAHDPDISAAFPDGVLWTSLGPTPNVLSELAAWGRALDIDLTRADSIEQASAVLAPVLPRRFRKSR